MIREDVMPGRTMLEPYFGGSGLWGYYASYDECM